MGERLTQTNLDPTKDEERRLLLKPPSAGVSTQNIPTFANIVTQPHALSVRARASQMTTVRSDPRPTEGWSPARAPAPGQVHATQRPGWSLALFTSSRPISLGSECPLP